jgi:carbon storage regulator CsrA
MLILSRRAGEEVTISDRQTYHEHTYIGPTVRLRVLSVTGNRVRLGFDAPDSTVVLRAELEQRRGSSDE